jgi:hypothetical protein
LNGQVFALRFSGDREKLSVVHPLARLIISGIVWFSVLASCCAAQVPSVWWAHQAVSGGNMAGSGVALDASGDAYAVGYLSASATFGRVTLNNGGGFLTKYDSLGNVLWALNVATDLGGPDMAVATDTVGNALIIGPINTSVTVGTMTITNPFGSSEASFVAKVDTDGNTLWAVPLSSFYGLVTHGTPADDGGNLYVVGGFSGDAIFGNTKITLFTPGNGGGFLAKFNTEGNLLWATRAGGTGMSVALDGMGNVFVVGSFYGPSSWGTGLSQTNITSYQTSGSMYLARYDTDGNVIWVVSQDNVGSLGVAAGIDGSSYIIGRQYQPNATGFVCEYSASGNLRWTKFLTNVYPSGVSVVSSNSIFLSGAYLGPADFGGGNVNLVSGSLDGFVAKYVGLGQLEWVRGFGGSNSSSVSAMAVSSSGQRICLTGSFTPGITLDEDTLATTGNFNGFFLADLEPGAPPPRLELQIYPGLTFAPVLIIHGIVGHRYGIEYTDSFRSNWQTFTTFDLPYSPYLWVDTSASNSSSRFYRVALLP